MKHPIKVAIINQENDIQSDWGALKEKVNEKMECQFNDIPMARDKLSNEIDNVFKHNDIILVGMSLRVQLEKHITHQTIRSHFMSYCDYLEKRSGIWWAESTFINFFYPTLLDVIRKQKFKGPAIFLGITPLCIPILDTLSRVGISEVAFLTVDSKQSALDKEFHESLNGLFGMSFSTVDSTSFIQSTKEYAFCFVSKESYEAQLLDDMSYFHFLSQRSTVFDLTGKSNFLFSEVKALGVQIVEEKEMSSLQIKAYLEKILQFDPTK